MGSLVTKETVSNIMIILAVLLILGGVAIMALGTIVENKKGYIKMIALLGGLIESLAGLIFIAFSIAFLR